MTKSYKKVIFQVIDVKIRVYEIYFSVSKNQEVVILQQNVNISVKFYLFEEKSPKSLKF